MDWLYVLDIWTVIETRLETEENDVKSWRKNSWLCSQDLTSRCLSSSPTHSCLGFFIARLESVVICHLSAYIIFYYSLILKKKDNILSACCHFSDLNLLHVMWNLSRSSHSYFESIYSYSLTRCMSQQPSCSYCTTNFCYLYDLIWFRSHETLYFRFTNYGSGAKRFPLQDVLLYALEFAQTRPQSSRKTVIPPPASHDVDMECLSPNNR